MASSSFIGRAENRQPEIANVSHLLNGRNDSTPLLSPPLSVHSERDAPFKPAESDNISLNMKRSHHDSLQHRQLTSQNPYHIRASGYCAVTTSPQQQQHSRLRSQSMPLLRPCTKFEGWDQSTTSRNTWHHTSVGDRVLGWTLPPKAAPTRVFTNYKSVSRQATPNDRFAERTSPAVITLRRATNQLQRESKLTFFPPPTFSSARGSLSSYLAMAVGNDFCQTTENMDFFTRQIEQSRRGRSASIVFGPTRLEVNAFSQPATIDVQPQVCFAPPSGTNFSRRSSTRYVSRTSIYEIIWDPNDTPTWSPQPSPRERDAGSENGQPDRQPSRRGSLAVEKLESHLARATAAASKSVAHDDARLGFADRRGSLSGTFNDKLHRVLSHLGR